MHVYDFDGTIYRGDSSIDFYLYCVKKHPRLVRYLPRQLTGIFLYKMGRYTKEKMKSDFFSFLSGLKDAGGDIDAFVRKNLHKIRKWYLEICQPSDVVISASPAFLIERFSEAMQHFTVIASDVDKQTGRLNGKNCYGEEKVQRFERRFPERKITLFYSDSKSDAPIAKLAEQAFLVYKDGRREKWIPE